MRLYPPAASFNRVTPSVDKYGDYEIPKGTMTSVSSTSSYFFIFFILNTNFLKIAFYNQRVDKHDNESRLCFVRMVFNSVAHPNNCCYDPVNAFMSRRIKVSKSNGKRETQI